MNVPSLSFPLEPKKSRKSFSSHPPGDPHSAITRTCHLHCPGVTNNLSLKIVPLQIHNHLEDMRRLLLPPRHSRQKLRGAPNNQGEQRPRRQQRKTQQLITHKTIIPLRYEREPTHTEWERRANPAPPNEGWATEGLWTMALTRNREGSLKNGTIGALSSATASANKEASTWAPLPTFDLRWYLNTDLDS
jgi:hypothetical protein